jgi:hypothetical protein
MDDAAPDRLTCLEHSVHHWRVMGMRAIVLVAGARVDWRARAAAGMVPNDQPRVDLYDPRCAGCRLSTLPKEASADDPLGQYL